MKKSLCIFFLMNFGTSLYTGIVSDLVRNKDAKETLKNSISRLEDVHVYEYSSKFKNRGFDNCNIKNNGELYIIKKIIKPGDIIFDVGANVGGWSEQVFSNTEDAMVYAFEPINFVYEKLQKSFVGKNGFAFNVALSNFVGSKIFYFYPKRPRLSGFYDREILREKLHLTPEEIEVATDTLDAFCNKNNIDHIDLLKIDTEGEEYNVLIGSLNMLEQKKISIIQFEYGGCYVDSQKTLRQVYDMLSGFGYSIFRILPKGLIKINVWTDELENFRYSNYLAVLKN